MSGRATSDHEDWERFLRLEREQIAERARGMVARAIGIVLPGEDWEELNRLAREDESRAQRGLVELRKGQRVWHKHIDDLACEDRPARLEAEREWNTWLRSRMERMKADQRERYS